MYHDRENNREINKNLQICLRDLYNNKQYFRVLNHQEKQKEGLNQYIKLEDLSYGNI